MEKEMFTQSIILNKAQYISESIDLLKYVFNLFEKKRFVVEIVVAHIKPLL